LYGSKKAEPMAALPKSPLARALPDLPPVAGVRFGAAAAGIRYTGRTDLVMAEFAPGTTVAGVFTRSKCPGAPVDWCRAALPEGLARALVVNAGNANVFTGRAGFEATQANAADAARLVRCAASQVFLASTGVIGEILPYQKISDALPGLYATLSETGWADAARGIMTTDTFPKAAVRETTIGGTSVRIQGIAKGSGMVAPDMATMLCFIATDAALPPSVLQPLLSSGTARSFNRTTVDSDTSTSDMVLLFATGQAGNPPVSSESDPALAAFAEALDSLLLELALLVVRDGEGATRLIRIHVVGATSDESAQRVAMAVANSPLVKTAIAGEDANWGRVVMAVGKSGEPANRDTLSIAIGGVWIARNGTVAPGYDETPVVAHMKGQEIDIDIDLGLGNGVGTAWSCDLTHGYIDINGAYRS
jgi:glutamate N-acetyltransferase / amino-acid N-acetyltransferase